MVGPFHLDVDSELQWLKFANEIQSIAKTPTGRKATSRSDLATVATGTVAQDLAPPAVRWG